MLDKDGNLAKEIQRLTAALERIDKTSLGCKCGEIAEGEVDGD